jgi:RraA family protein
MSGDQAHLLHGTPGFCIRPAIERPAADTLRALAAFPVALVGDGLGRRAILSEAIKPLRGDVRLVGPAITVEVPPGDNLMIHAALRVARPGDVLVVDARGDLNFGLWGGILTAQAKAQGLAGLVIDGAIRDSEELAASDFPIFCRGVCPRGGDKSGPGQVNLPISIAGVAVQPGDVILGDADGVLIVPRDALATAIDGAGRREAVEKKRLAQIAAGRPGADWLIPALRAAGVLDATADL